MNLTLLVMMKFFAGASVQAVVLPVPVRIEEVEITSPWVREVETTSPWLVEVEP